MEIKHYEMRQLSSKDIFPMSKIISKIGMKEFSKAFQSDSVIALIGAEKKDVSAVGFSVIMDIAGIILENLPSCEKEIYAFLANITGKKPTEIQEIPIADFAQMVIDLVQKEEFKDFIKVVSKLFNSEN